MDLNQQQWNHFIKTGQLQQEQPDKPNQKRSKYNAKKTRVDGICFDSKKEAERYQELKLLKQAGAIRWFALQCTFALPGGIKYRADFVVVNNDGSVDVEDVKGFKTPEYKLKKKLMRETYQIQIVER